MNKIVELLSSLTLTIFALVLPILSIIVGLYNEAFKKLSEQYQIEKMQTQENINGQLSKIKVDDSNIETIQNSLNELKLLNKAATRKLNLLNPGKQFLKISISTGLSFIFFAAYFVIEELFSRVNVLQIPVSFAFAFCGLLALLYLVGYLLKLFNIVVKASNIQNQNRVNYESIVKELLIKISEGFGDSPYLKSVYISERCRS